MKCCAPRTTTTRTTNRSAWPPNALAPAAHDPLFEDAAVASTDSLVAPLLAGIMEDQSGGPDRCLPAAHTPAYPRDRRRAARTQRGTCLWWSMACTDWECTDRPWPAGRATISAGYPPVDVRPTRNRTGLGQCGQLGASASAIPSFSDLDHYTAWNREKSRRRPITPTA